MRSCDDGIKGCHPSPLLLEGHHYLFFLFINSVDIVVDFLVFVVVVAAASIVADFLRFGF